MRYKSLFLVIASAVFSFGQAPNQSQHSHAAVAKNMIDGRVHPELIKDVDAYRLVLATIADSISAPTDSTKGKTDPLQPIGLEDADRKSAVEVLLDFKAKYDALIKRFNDSATAADAHGVPVDISGFLTDRDALVEETRNQLANFVSPKGMAALHAHVQREKNNMQIGVEDAQ